MGSLWRLGTGLKRSLTMKRSTDERSLRRRLLDGETLYGLVIKAPAPALVEMCAAAGFDFAFIDGEHGSGEALELEHHVRAAESFGMPAVVRIASHQPVGDSSGTGYWCRRYYYPACEHLGGSGSDCQSRTLSANRQARSRNDDPRRTARVLRTWLSRREHSSCRRRSFQLDLQCRRL